MFDTIKRQKQQKSNRQSLQVFPHLLQQPSSILLKSYPNIDKLNMLKIITCIHVNYIMFTYIETLQKANNINVSLSNSKNNIGLENIKIGIIGGGVMGRLFLNNLLILQKIGVDPVNITVSTRQEEDMEIYKTLFKVNIAFDNEKLAEESDILIITTPATLDNWIVVDLRQILQARANRINPNQNQNLNALSTQKQPQPPQKYPLNPLVYITTSNMTKEKLSKLFNIPFIIPIVRGHEEQYLSNIIKQCKKDDDNSAYIENIQKFIIKRIEGGLEDFKEALSYAFQRYFYTPQRQKKYTSITSSQKNNKSGKTLNLDIKLTQDRQKQKQKQKQKISKSQRVSEQASKKSSVNLSNFGNTTNSNISSNYNLEIVKNVVEEVLVTNESMEQTFLVRCRKWRMAYNNFIA